jgi:hypothetical protein
MIVFHLLNSKWGTESNIELGPMFVVVSPETSILLLCETKNYSKSGAPNKSYKHYINLSIFPMIRVIQERTLFRPLDVVEKGT